MGAQIPRYCPIAIPEHLMPYEAAAKAIFIRANGAPAYYKATRIGEKGMLQRLLALARELLQSPNRESILKLVGSALMDLLAADGALLLLQVGEKENFTELDRDGHVRPGQLPTELYRHARKALHDRKLFVLSEVPGMAKQAAEIPAVLESKSILAFPFPPIEPVGVLAACWARRSGRDLSGRIFILSYLGELTAAALGNAILINKLEARVAVQSNEAERVAREHTVELGLRDNFEDELQHIAIADVMTGILNRRGFFLQAEQSLKIARRSGLGAAVIFVDIDGLKSINDALGHEVGDQLIQDSAAVLKASFRDSDVVARLGGDEFAAFTIDSAQPETILARIRKHADDFNERLAKPYRISFSAGIVPCDPSSHVTLSDYISQADTKMYEQKRSRHDRHFQLTTSAGKG